MWLYVGIGLALIVVALVVFVATRPNSFRVERTAIIEAPPAAVFAIINDLTEWGRWSPYDHLDPEMKKTYTGPRAGVGAEYAWEGNNKVGAGKLMIVESRPAELVRMKLEFSRPFACCNDVRFQLEPASRGTQMSWIMDGKHTFFSKLMSLVISMDNMCGKDFERGLANLNQVVNSAHVA